MTFIADLFAILRTRKTWLDICLKSPFSKDPLTGQHGKRVQTLLRSDPQHRYHI